MCRANSLPVTDSMPLIPGGVVPAFRAVKKGPSPLAEALPYASPRKPVEVP